MLKNGYYSHQVKPRENETELPPEMWTDIGEGKNKFDRLPPAGTIITEPTAVYYLVAASPFNEPGDRFFQYFFTKHGIYKIELHAIDFKDIDVDFESNQGTQKKTISNDDFRALHIRMTGTAIDPAERGDFELLGLKGDIDLYLDPETRVLIQISGAVDIIGYTDVKLKAVSFQ